MLAASLYPESVIIEQYSHHSPTENSSPEAHRDDGTAAIDKQDHTAAYSYAVVPVCLEVCLSGSSSIGNDSDLQSLHILDLCCKDRLKYIISFSIVSKSTLRGVICICTT